MYKNTVFAILFFLFFCVNVVFAAVVITNVNYPSSTFKNSNITISSTIYDDVGGSIDLALFVTISPEAGTYNIENVGGDIYNITYWPNETGYYHFYLWARNNNGDSDVSDTFYFYSMDDSPNITNSWVDPDPAVKDYDTEIYANVTDADLNINNVWVEILTPFGEEENISMNAINVTTGQYGVNYTPDQYANYSYYIWASDDKGTIAHETQCNVLGLCFQKKRYFTAIRPYAVITNVTHDQDSFFYVNLPLAMGEPNITMSATIVNEFGENEHVKLFIDLPNGTRQEYTPSNTSDYYYYTYHPTIGGIHTFTFEAKDTQGIITQDSSTFKTIVSRPWFYNVTISPKWVNIPIGENVTITMNLGDFHGDFEEAWINITSPVEEKVFFNKTGVDFYTLIYTVQNEGWHYFYINANDSRGNLAYPTYLAFSDYRASEEVNVSVEVPPYCCLRFEYLGFTEDINETQLFWNYPSYDPTYDYSVYQLMLFTSTASNCGNVNVNITENCIYFRKNPLLPGDEVITITGDNSTNIVSYCCWDDYANSFFCEYNKTNIYMPAFMSYNYEYFYAYLAKFYLYPGNYTATAQANYENYNETVCEEKGPGYTGDDCICNKYADLSINFTILDEEGTDKEFVPFPNPVPIGAPESAPNLVIIREMPQKVDQRANCSLENISSCYSLPVRLIIYNRGGKPAQEVNVTDFFRAVDEGMYPFCYTGGTTCSPVKIDCSNTESYTCAHEIINNGGNLTFYITEEIEAKSYIVIEYDVYPTAEQANYEDTTAYYQFDATSEYGLWKIENNINYFYQMNTTLEDDIHFNTMDSRISLLSHNKSSNYDIYANRDALPNKRRTFSAGRQTIFKYNIDPFEGELTAPWTIDLSLPQNITISSCSTFSVNINCSFSPTEHKITYWSDTYDLTHIFPVYFSARSVAQGGFLINVNASFMNNMQSDEYIPGLFINALYGETTSMAPHLIIVREMPDSIPQKENCSLNNRSSCERVDMRLIVYNDGSRSAVNVTMEDEITHSCSDENCSVIRAYCVDGDYSCTVDSPSQTKTTLEYNITSIEAGTFVLLKYSFHPTSKTSLYTAEGINNYDFYMSGDYKDEQDYDYSTYENDETYNPFGSNILYLKNKPSFDYNISIDGNSTKREFLMMENTTFRISLIAKTADTMSLAPQQMSIIIPERMDVLSVLNVYGGDNTCSYNSISRIINCVFTSKNLSDSEERVIRFDAKATSTGIYMFSINTQDNSSANSNFMPGIFTLSRRTYPAVQEENIKIIREMPETTFNETFRVKLILFNSGEYATDINVEDVSYIDLCTSFEAGGCSLVKSCVSSPVGADDIHYYTCGIDADDNVDFHVNRLQSQDYVVLEYDVSPPQTASTYAGNGSLFKFQAIANYTQYNKSVFSIENSILYNPDRASYIGFVKSSGFDFALDAHRVDVGSGSYSEENSKVVEERDFPIGSTRKLTFMANAMDECNESSWNVTLLFPPSFTIYSADYVSGPLCSCEFDNSPENPQVICEGKEAVDANQTIIVTAEVSTLEVNDFLLNASYRFGNIDMDYIGGVFLLTKLESNYIEEPDFIPSPNLVIIREMAEHINQTDNCDPSNPWATCQWAENKIIIYNRGNKDAINVSLDDFSFSHCDSANTSSCNPVAARCIENLPYYNCSVDSIEGLQKSHIHFEVNTMIEPKGYVILRYEYIPALNLTMYENNENYYWFNAYMDYTDVAGTQYPTSRENDGEFNPEEANKIYLKKNASFEFYFDTIALTTGEQRLADRGNVTYFSVQIKARDNVDNASVVFYFDSLWDLYVCNPANPLDSCIVDSVNKTLTFSSLLPKQDQQTYDFTFTATNYEEEADFIGVNYTINNHTTENIPGIFLLSKEKQREFGINPFLYIVRELPEVMAQDFFCQFNDNRCIYVKNRLFLYNFGTRSAYNITLDDALSEHCVGNCSIRRLECLTEEEKNYKYNYNCSVSNNVITFTFDNSIEPQEYAVAEYKVYGTKNMSLYDNVNYYSFSAIGQYINEEGTGMRPAGEEDGYFNPLYSNYMYLSNISEFDFDVDTYIMTTQKERYLFSGKSSYFKLELSSVFESLPADSSVSLDFPDGFVVSSCTTSSSLVNCTLVDLDTVNIIAQKNITKTSSDYVKVVVSPHESGGFIVRSNYTMNSVPQSNRDYNPGFFVLVKKPTETFQLNPQINIIREMPESIPQKTLCSSNNTFGTCEYFVNRVFLYNKGATEARDIIYTESWTESYCSVGSTHCQPLYFECPANSVVNWTVYNESNGTYSLPVIMCEKRDNNTLVFNITKPLYPRNYVSIEYIFAPAQDMNAYSSVSYYEFDGIVDYQNQIRDVLTSTETDEIHNPLLANTLYLTQNSSMNYYFSVSENASHNNRSFMIDEVNNATLSFSALAGDNTIPSPVLINITVPDDITVSDCQFSSGGGMCDIVEKNITAGINNNLLSITYSSSMADKNSATLDLVFNSSSFSDWVVPLYAYSNMSMSTNYNPGLFLLSKDFLYKNVTVIEYVPQPEPVPTPQKSPQPTPEEYSANGVDYKLEVRADETLPPKPPSEKQMGYRVVLEIKPLNFTQSTYQGSAVPVVLNITNIDEKMLENIDIVGVKFEGWAYTDSNIEKLDVGESVLRTVMVQPSTTTEPGFYVVPISGLIGEEQGGIGFFKLQVLKILRLARVEIMESPSRIRLKKNSLAKVPILVKNTGEVNLTNISVQLDALDCLSVVESDTNQTEYPSLDVNESLSISVAVRTNDADICRGSIIIGADQNTYAFSQMIVELRSKVGLKVPSAYYWIIVAAILVILLLFWKIKKSSAVNNVEIEEVKKEVGKT